VGNGRQRGYPDAAVSVPVRDHDRGVPARTSGPRALECGYSSASLRERIYLGTTAAPTAGVLLSTAASDSEGTLGGLVALGHPRHLERLLGRAFEEALHCSSDPLCAEHVPINPSATLHAAACHACLFASETSCEAGNRWLDRAVLADLTHDGLAFIP
jgi:hypothetical protein